MLDWDTTLRTAAERAHLIAVDRPGSGWSERDWSKTYRLKDYAAHLAAVLDALEIDEPPLLVGHAYGAAAALTYALEWPDDVRGLLLLGPIGPGMARPAGPLLGLTADPARAARLLGNGPLRWLARRALVAGRRRSFIPNQDRLSPERLAHDIALWTRPGQLAATAQETLGLAQDLDALTRRLGYIDVPTTIVHGRADLVVPWKVAETLAKAIPDARLLLFDYLGHEVQHALPDEISRLIGGMAGGDGPYPPDPSPSGEGGAQAGVFRDGDLS